MRRLLTTLLALSLFVTAAAQRMIVTDSGGTEREVSRLIVVDSGGTSREIQRGFVVDSGGTARQFYSGALVEAVDVTLGNTGGTIGYFDSLTGSINPDPFTVNGASLEGITSSSFNGWDLRVNLIGVSASTHFTSVLVEDGDGTPVEFLTTNATYADLGGTEGQWTWGNGTSAIWATGDVSETHAATFTTE